MRSLRRLWRLWGLWRVENDTDHGDRTAQRGVAAESRERGSWCSLSLYRVTCCWSFRGPAAAPGTRVFTSWKNREPTSQKRVETMVKMFNVHMRLLA